MAPSSESSSFLDMTAKANVSSNPRTQSKESGYASTISSHSSKDSETSYKGQMNLALHLRGQNARLRSASSSVYEDSINGHDEQRKENIRPRAGTLSNHSAKPESTQKSLFVPLLRRARSNLGKTLPSHPPPGERTKWDHKGGPTHVGNSKTVQHGLSNYDTELGYPKRSDFGIEVSISGGTEKPRKPTFAERAAKFSRDALPEVRPPWKGGNGRSAQPEPAKSTPQTTSPNVYTATKSTQGVHGRTYTNKTGADGSIDGFFQAGSLGQRAQLPVRNKSHTHLVDSQRGYTSTSISPVPTAVSRKAVPYYSPLPEKVQASSPKVNLDDTAIAPFSEGFKRRGSADSDDSTTTIGRREMQQPKSHFSWSTCASSVRDDEEDEEEDDDDDDGSDSDEGRKTPDKKRFGEQNLASRFSWTTVNTSTTYQRDSPPCSPPALPTQPPSPIMMRRRPVTRELPVSGTATISSGSSQTTIVQTSRPGSSSSTNNKALPLPPILAQENTHMEALQAKSNDLDLRVANTQKVISEMQKMEQASPLEVTEKMRRENRKRLEQMSTRLEEVQRERHEVGMALARARSRAQKEEGEASSLWLRRVTG